MDLETTSWCRASEVNITHQIYYSLISLAAMPKHQLHLGRCFNYSVIRSSIHTI